MSEPATDPADVAFAHWLDGLRSEPRDQQEAEARGLRYHIGQVDRSTGHVVIGIHVAGDPRLYQIVVPLVDDGGRAVRLDVPAHHLEAFVQGGPLSLVPQTFLRDVVLVDGSSYFS